MKGRYRGRDVAIKKPILGTTSDLVFFRREISIMSRLDHPNIIGVSAARMIPPGKHQQGAELPPVSSLDIEGQSISPCRSGIQSSRLSLLPCTVHKSQLGAMHNLEVLISWRVSWVMSGFPRVSSSHAMGRSELEQKTVR